MTDSCSCGPTGADELSGTLKMFCSEKAEKDSVFNWYHSFMGHWPEVVLFQILLETCDGTEMKSKP